MFDDDNDDNSTSGTIVGTPFPVTVTRQVWINDDAHETGQADLTFDLAPFIAETPYDRRWTEFGDIDGPGALDFWVNEAEARGLIEPLTGPFYATCPALERFIQRHSEDGLRRLPLHQAIVIDGVPLAQPLTLEQIIDNANTENRTITVTLEVDLVDFVEQTTSDDEDNDAGAYLGKILGGEDFLPYDPSFVIRSVVNPQKRPNIVLIDYTSGINALMDNMELTPTELRQTLYTDTAYGDIVNKALISNPNITNLDTEKGFASEVSLFAFYFALESLASGPVPPHAHIAELRRRAIDLARRYVAGVDEEAGALAYAIFRQVRIAYVELLTHHGYREEPDDSSLEAFFNNSTNQG